MSKRGLKDITEDNFRKAHTSIKAMRQKIAQSKVALDRWDSAQTDVALQAAENKWKNRTRGNVFRAWYKVVRKIQQEREEHRLNPPKLVKVDNSDQNFKKYGSMIELVKGMKSRCEKATHILEVDHAEEHVKLKRCTETDKEKSCSRQVNDSPEYNRVERELSPLSQLSNRIHRETRQRDSQLRERYKLPLQHYEAPMTCGPHGTSHHSFPLDDHNSTINGDSDDDDWSVYHSPRVHSHRGGLTPQAPLTVHTTVRKASPRPISVDFYRPVSSPDKPIPTWLKYKHKDYYG